MDKKAEAQIKIEKIIDELIKNAEALVHASKHDPSEPALEQLQIKQEKLLNDLREAEKGLSGYFDVKDRLEQFGKLNREYIRNLANIHGIIYFHKEGGSPTPS